MRYQWKKSIVVDFDQFITLVNKWKAKSVHEGYSFFQKKKNTKKAPVSAVLRKNYFTLLYFTFSIERTIARIREGLFNEGFN